MATKQQSNEASAVNKNEATVDFKSMSIFEKMMHVRKNIGPIHKKLDVVSEDNSDRYKGVAAADIITPIENLFEKVGIFKVPGEIDYQVNGRLTTQCQQYHFYNIDNPSEHITAHSSGQGFDMADKGINAASTNAIKYMYMRMFGLMAQNEDPETVHSMDKAYNASQMTAPPAMGGAPQGQQTQYQPQGQALYQQEQAPVQEKTPEAERFEGLIKEAINANIPANSIYNYLNQQFFSNNHVDFTQLHTIDQQSLHTVNEALESMMAPYRAKAVTT